MQISQQQETALSALHDPRVIDLLFGGGAGGGKSLLVTLWAVLECRKYKGIRIGLGRKEISNLRKTTIQTLLMETHPLLNVQQRDYKYSAIVDPKVKYRNGSEIIFVDLAYAPSDPDYDRLGSLNLTHTIIEEMGEVRKKARDVFTSRKNRYLNDRHGIVGKSVGTCNPSTNFLRTEYYDPYAKLGGGGVQQWPIVNDAGEPIYVNIPGGKRVPALRAFVRSLVTDNPFISENYIEELKAKPLAERKRLLKGNWDYYHDERTLFKRSMFVKKSHKPKGQGYAGCDPARGGDETVFTYIKGNRVHDIEKVTIPADTKDIGTFVAGRFIKFCKARNVGYLNAAVDIVGNGESVGDACNRLGFPIRRFNAGSTQGVRTLDDTKQHERIDERGEKGVRLFDLIRSQNFYDMAQAANSGELTFTEGLPHYDQLCTQLEAHGYTTKERMIFVDKKDVIKTRIGQSPDVADSLQAAWWIMHKTTYGLKDLVSL